MEFNPSVSKFLWDMFVNHVEGASRSFQSVSRERGFPLADAAFLEIYAFLAWNAFQGVQDLPPSDLQARMLKAMITVPFLDYPEFGGDQTLAEEVLDSRFALYYAVSGHVNKELEVDFWCAIAQWLDTQILTQPPNGPFEPRLTRAAFVHPEIMERVPERIAALGPAEFFPAPYAGLLNLPVPSPPSEIERHKEHLSRLQWFVLGHALPLCKIWYRFGRLNDLSGTPLPQLEAIVDETFKERRAKLEIWAKDYGLSLG